MMELDTILQGDAWELAKTLPDQSVQCIVTSPPYFGLRDYGTAQWEGGDAACDHTERRMHTTNGSTLRNDGRPKPGMQETDKTQGQSIPYRDICAKCGARRVDAQFGLESSPAEYVARLVELFAELRRVLRDDGVVFLNLGDSYNGGGGYAPDAPSNQGRGGFNRNAKTFESSKRKGWTGLKPKDLCMIPARVAIALQDDGWWLRQEIVWHKRAPMPESVTDRCTRAHEMVYMLSKRATYYYDADAVREPHTGPMTEYRRVNGYEAQGPKRETLYEDTSTSFKNGLNPAGRNRRSVWTLGPESYRGAHFAVMPTKLVEPCILSGTSAKGCCSVCGAPWARVVERMEVGRGATASRLEDGINERSSAKSLATKRQAYRAMGLESPPPPVTTDWQPTCAHDAEPVPCVVLDPFAGSGTVAAVAASLGRSYIGFELNEDYVALANRRLSAVTLPLLAEAL